MNVWRRGLAVGVAAAVCAFSFLASSGCRSYRVKGLIKKKRYEAALGELKGVSKKYPLLKARALLGAGKIREAYLSTLSALVVRSKRKEAALLAARLADRLGYGQPVLELLEIARKAGQVPGWTRKLEARWRLRRAAYLLGLGAPAAALKDVKAAARLGVKGKTLEGIRAKSHELLALRALSREQAKKAGNHFKKARRFGPRIAKPWWGWAVKLARGKQIDSLRAGELTSRLCMRKVFNLAAKAALGFCSKPGFGAWSQICASFSLGCALKGAYQLHAYKDAAKLVHRGLKDMRVVNQAEVVVACRFSENPFGAACRALKKMATGSKDALVAYERLSRGWQWRWGDGRWVKRILPRLAKVGPMQRSLLVKRLDPAAVLPALPKDRYLLRAELLRRAGKHRQALKLLDQALKQKRWDGFARLAMGLESLRFQDPASARAHIRWGLSTVRSATGIPAAAKASVLMQGRWMDDVAVLMSGGTVRLYRKLRNEALEALRTLPSDGAAVDRVKEIVEIRMLRRGYLGPALALLSHLKANAKSGVPVPAGPKAAPAAGGKPAAGSKPVAGVGAGRVSGRLKLLEPLEREVRSRLGRWLALKKLASRARGKGETGSRGDAVSRAWESMVGRPVLEAVFRWVETGAALRGKTRAKGGSVEDAVLPAARALCAKSAGVKTAGAGKLKTKPVLEKLRALARSRIRSKECGIDEASPTLWLARVLWLSGRKRKAARALMDVLDTGPKGFGLCRVDAVLRRLAELGLKWQASELAWNVARRFGSDPVLLGPAVKGLIQTGSLGRAVHASTDFVRASYDDGQAYRKLAEWYAKAGWMPQANSSAINFFHWVGSPAPGRVAILRMAAGLMAMSGSTGLLTRQTTLWRAAVKDRLQRRFVDLQVGRAALDAGRADLAVKFLKRAPGLLATALLRSGKLSEAFKAFGREVEEHPLRALPLCRLARVAMRMKRIKQAETFVERAMRVEPDADCSRFVVAEMAVRAGRHVDAEALYALVIETQKPGTQPRGSGPALKAYAGLFTVYRSARRFDLALRLAWEMMRSSKPEVREAGFRHLWKEASRCVWNRRKRARAGGKKGGLRPPSAKRPVSRKRQGR